MNNCSLRWLANFSASCIHAADAVAHGERLIDPQLDAHLRPIALQLNQEILAARIPSEPFWRNLNAFAYQIENNRELVALVLRKTVGGSHDSLNTLLAGRISDLEAAMRQVFPKLLEQLELRARPLREIWEAHGPGLLRLFARSTDEQLLVDTADVVLVHPVLGGAGAAHLSNNSVRLEAVLTNNLPRLPEVVRLGWLVTQLNQDLPVYSEQLPADRRLPVIALASLSPVLQAAHELELIAPPDRGLVAHAISAWKLASDSEQTADAVSLWWETYRASPLPWPSALMALDKMVSKPT